MTKKQTKRNDRFYDDIARQHYSPGCCSAPAVLVVSLLVLFVGALLIWIVLKPVGDASQGQTRIGSFKLPSLLSSRTGSATSDEYRAHVTDAELNAVVSHIDIPNTNNKNIHIHKDAIELTATSPSPINAPLVLKFVPEVKDGHVTIVVHDLTIAGVRALPLATDAVRKSISSALEGSLSGQFSGTITRIVLEEGALSVYWTPKKQ